MHEHANDRDEDQWWGEGSEHPQDKLARQSKTLSVLTEHRSHEDPENQASNNSQVERGPCTRPEIAARFSRRVLSHPVVFRYLFAVNSSRNI